LSYRPQFAYQTPSKVHDETFHYVFDGSNVQALSGTLAAGVFDHSGIPLGLQSDAPFAMRGFKVAAVAGSPLLIQMRDCWGNYLSDSYIPINLYAAPSGTPLFGSLVIPWEPDLICPAGGTWWVYLGNPTGGAVAKPAFTFYGLKRYPGAN
jgi:hypothetical protein